MRTTVASSMISSAPAQEFTGVTEKTALIRQALKALIERGPMAGLNNVPRRRMSQR